jgi:tRNA(fMet)-specific endonuclease VapC
MLDTNICIYLIKKNPKPYFDKMEILSRSHKISISSIVLSELQYGISKSNFKEKSQIALNLLLTQLEVLPYTEQCSTFYGEVRYNLSTKGIVIGSNDMLIAAHALCEKAILVSNNKNEFSRIPNLILEDWGYT